MDCACLLLQSSAKCGISILSCTIACIPVVCSYIIAVDKLKVSVKFGCISHYGWRFRIHHVLLGIHIPSEVVTYKVILRSKSLDRICIIHHVDGHHIHTCCLNLTCLWIFCNKLTLKSRITVNGSTKHSGAPEVSFII